MLDYKNIEEELDLILATVEKDLDQVNKEKESLKIIEKDILEINDESLKNISYSLKDIKEDLSNVENLNKNLKYIEFYQALNKIESEKDYLNKLDLINKIVRLI